MPRDSILGDRYVITRELARDNDAAVYHAEDRVLGRDVAVKVLSPEQSGAIGQVRFDRAVAAMSRLVHPNIVPILDSGSIKGQLYYVTPFVGSDTLRARIAREGLMTPDESAQILADVGEALAYAHGAGLVHGDIRPENIFCHHGRAMVADFGIARAIQAASGPDASEAATDARTDIFALGCVSFEMLTGDQPFPGSAGIVTVTDAPPVPRVRTKVPTTPSRIAELTERMLSRGAGAAGATPATLIATARTIVEPAVQRPSARAGAASPGEQDDANYDQASIDACREGRALFQRSYQGGQGAREKLEYAKSLFERARDIDPANPYALIGLADVHHVLAFRGYGDFRENTRKATELRAEALQYAPDLPDVHFSIAVELLYWKDDFATAGAEYRRGMKSGRVRPEMHRLYGAYLKMAGQLDEALQHMKLGLAEDPRAPALHVGLADVLLSMGRYVEAVEPLQQALKLAPGYESALERLDVVCHRLGRHDEALDARRALHGLRQQPQRIDALDADAAQLGPMAARDADIRRDLAALHERVTTEDPFTDLNVSRQLADYMVMAHAELGEWHKAMDWVERGFYRRPGRLRRVLLDLPFEHRGLAVDPRYAPMLRTAGLEEFL
ncbi:MAG: serine/threonine-protein kinase [Gemmatimonadota bacterium]|nr:serine/threonine-protein kinase [Gemmatimonadota bacterium]